MKKLFKLVMLMLCITSAQKAVAQSNVEKKIQIGPEGDSALYYWNPLGSGGTGHWQLASDSAGLMYQKTIGVPKIGHKIGLLIEDRSVEFFFDGYWRMAIRKESI